MYQLLIRCVDNVYRPIVTYKSFDECYRFMLKNIVIYGGSVTRYKIKHLDFNIIIDFIK